MKAQHYLRKNNITSQIIYATTAHLFHSTTAKSIFIYQSGNQPLHKQHEPLTHITCQRVRICNQETNYNLHLGQLTTIVLLIISKNHWLFKKLSSLMIWPIFWYLVAEQTKRNIIITKIKTSLSIIVDQSRPHSIYALQYIFYGAMLTDEL